MDATAGGAATPAQDIPTQPLIGRFAPSPTGDLHFGSLLSAVASYCDSKSQQGLWQLRIDDIDGPRSVAGSASAIQRSLETYGFEWDGQIIWQSQRLDHYADALTRLVALQKVFACNCSRRMLPPGEIYPGICQSHLLSHVTGKHDYRIDDHALRCRLSGSVTLDDIVQKKHHFNLDSDVGDIVIWRRDGLVSYALACAVDDAELVSHVVRGADLLENTAAQIGIMKLLGQKLPQYAHIPIAMDCNGDKLSKHSKATPISELECIPTLLQAWSFLGQMNIQPESLTDFWNQALQHWQMDRIPGVRKLPE